MGKAVRTTLSLVVSLVLFSAVALAHASGKHSETGKSKNNEHHSRLAKVAFWRHHKQSAGEKNQKQVQHARKMSKAPAKKASAAKRPKPKEKV
jgi:hypothetical protein